MTQRRAITSTRHRTPAGLRALITRYRGDVKTAAASIGMSRQGLWPWVARFDLYEHIAEQRRIRSAKPPSTARASKGEELDGFGEPGASRAETLRALVIQYGGRTTVITKVLRVNRATLGRWLRWFGLTEFTAQVRRERRATYRL